MPEFTFVVPENKYSKKALVLSTKQTDRRSVVIPVEKDKRMINENQELKDPNNNLLSVLIGILVGSLAGAVTVLLIAPKSGKETRNQIKEKGIELRHQATGFVEDTIAQVRSNVDDLTSRGLGKIEELKQSSQKLAIEQLDNITTAAKAGKKAVRNA